MPAVQGPLSGRRVLVTGASSGIGAAAALAFARAGATVGLCARRGDRLADVLAQCRDHNSDCRMWVVDLADLDQVPVLAEQAETQFGGVDIVVNNAGIPKRRRVESMTALDVEGVMAVNYFSPVRMTLALLPGMLARNFGHIINVSSMGVHSLPFGVGAYAASKAALELFTEALYLELTGTGVHAHLFVPGTTRTEFSTEKEGNDPPFPMDPAMAASAEDVAQALVACWQQESFMTFATDRDQGLAAKKSGDPNAFLSQMRHRFITPPSR